MRLASRLIVPKENFVLFVVSFISIILGMRVVKKSLIVGWILVIEILLVNLGRRLFPWLSGRSGRRERRVVVRGLRNVVGNNSSHFLKSNFI